MSAEFTVVRSTTVDAPASAVHEQIADFRNWRAWSPWEDADPQLRRTYSGPDSGEGTHYAWSGNRRAGAGEMTITRDLAPGEIGIDLHFTKPFEARNRVVFTIGELTGGGTQVTWTMTGRKMLIARILGPLMKMDAMIGKDFDTGLARLKQVVEKA